MAYLGRLPDLLLALLVLLIGWLVAGIVSKAVKAALKKTDFDNKMMRWMKHDGDENRLQSGPQSRQHNTKYSPEEIISKIVFWIIMAFAFIMFFNMLNLPYVAQPLSNALGVMAAAIPNILKAVLIAAVAWLIASVLSYLVKNVGRKAGLGRLMSRWNMVKDPANADRTLHSASRAVFYLTLLLFLPAVLAALGIDAISEPLKGMLDGFFAFIPKLLGAALILGIGWVVAKVVREILTNFLRSVGTDHLADRFGLSSPGKPSFSLSSVIGTVVYVLILIPTVISALEKLDIKGISGPAVSMLDRVMDMIPNMIVAAILVAVGLWLGKKIKQFVTGLLERAGFNAIFSRMGLGSLDSKANRNMTVSQIVGFIAQAVVVLLFTIEALQLVGLESLVSILTAVLAYVPMVLTAIIVLGIGFYVGDLVKRIVMSMVKQPTEGKLLGNIAKYTIIALTFFMALDQLGVAKTIVNAAFILILGGFTIAFGLAFGLGGRDFAAQTMRRLSQRMENTTITKPDPNEWKQDNTSLADFKTQSEPAETPVNYEKPHTISRDRLFDEQQQKKNNNPFNRPEDM
ncbi:mechanosensitive ion channel [Fictibacillus iocasae]